MKKTLGRAIAGAIALAASSAQAQQTIQISCPKAVLMDADSQAYLFEKNADERSSPASLAKLMTAEILFSLLKSGQATLNTTYNVSENAWRTGGAPGRGSTMFAQLNARIRVEDLIRGLVITSGNDAAIVIAENIAGSDENFALMMTKRAKELGLNNSSFANSWGRSDPAQRVSVRDMARLADHIVRAYPEYYKYFSEKDFTWNKVTQSNRNPLLLMNIGADGLKTGNVDDSGYAIVGSATMEGRRLFVVLNGCKTASERAEDAKKLLTWGFHAFDQKVVYEAGEAIGAVKIYGGSPSEVPVSSERQVKIFSPRGSHERLTGAIVYEGPIHPPVRKGDRIARLKVMRGHTLALDIPLRADADAEAGGLPRRAFDAGAALAGDVMRKYLFKK